MQSRKVTDFRDALKLAEENGELIRIDAEVDPLDEVPMVVAQIAKLKPIPMVLFERIKGYPDWKICGAMFSDMSRTARSLDFPVEGRESKLTYLSALANPIPPRVVATGPCKENRFSRGIDIKKLVPPHKGARMVEHQYYQPLVITKNPRTGETNIGIYRSAIQGPDEVTVNLRWTQHSGLHLAVAKEMGMPLPVALCIGVHPALYIAATTKMGYGRSEFEFAGAIMGKPVDLVKCETIDLDVPADSEIVIEGEIRPPYRMGSEGPWPEYLKYLGMNIQPPIMKITAVTFRNHPINNIFVPGGAPNILGMGTQAQLLRHLRAFAGEFVQDSWITPATILHHAIVQVKKTEAHHEGLQVSVGLAALGLGSTLIDTVTLVDEDVNIYDYAKVDWAIASRCNPKNQVHILPEARCHQNNPIAGVHELFGEPINRAKMIIDATIPWKYRQTEKGAGLTYFTLSHWDPVDLNEYLEQDDAAKWL